MPSFDPTVSENIRALQRQLNRLATSPVGPTSIGPGEGPFRFYTDTGDTAMLGPDGVRVAFRGALTGVSPLLEQHQTTIEAQGARLGTAEGSIAGHGTRLTAAETNILAQAGQINTSITRLNGVESKNLSQDTTIGSHGTRIAAAETNILAQAGQINGALTRLGAVESKNVSQDTWIDSHSTRLGNVEAKNTAQDSAISTAQARADSAHTRIDGLNYASPGDIATLSNQVQALRSQVHDWMQTARASNPSLPPPIPN